MLQCLCDVQENGLTGFITVLFMFAVLSIVSETDIREMHLLYIQEYKSDVLGIFHMSVYTKVCATHIYQQYCYYLNHYNYLNK